MGVGQSQDNPADAAVILFVDRRKIAGKLPTSIDGQRVRVILMDRLHVTRSHQTPAHTAGSCFSSHRANDHSSAGSDSLEPLDLFDEHLQLLE